MSVVRREVLRIPSSSVEVKSHFAVSFLYFLSLIIVAVETKTKNKKWFEIEKHLAGRQTMAGQNNKANGDSGAYPILTYLNWRNA